MADELRKPNKLIGEIMKKKIVPILIVFWVISLGVSHAYTPEPTLEKLVQESDRIVVGKVAIKETIKEAILEGEIPNEHDAAFKLMLKKGKALGLTAVDV